MHTANCLLSLGGDHGNQVMKHDVTAAEIAVLRAIHGDDAVQEVEPTGKVERSHREERERLLNIYGAAKAEDNTAIVAGMFPGVASRVFTSLGELGLPDSYFKATGRLRAATAAQADAEPIAGEQAVEDDAPAHDAPFVETDDTDDTVGDDINDGHGEAENVLG